MFYTCRPCFNQRVDLRHFLVDSLQFCNNVAESLLMNGLFRICDILWVVDKRLLFEDVGLQKRQKLFLSVISRPYGTIQSHLCYSVASVCLWRYVLWLNGASYSYWQPIGTWSRIWEIDWYQNEWPWPLFRSRVKVMSTIALHSTLNSSETVTDRGLVRVQRTTNRKWHMGYQMVTWPMTSFDPERCCEAVRSVS